MANGVKWSIHAQQDLHRLRAFVNANSPQAAAAAIDLIVSSTHELDKFPRRGRALVEDEPEYREILVPFSSSGYVVLYRVEKDHVEVQAVRHMREAGYRSPG